MSPNWRQFLWVIVGGVVAFFALTLVVYLSMFENGNPIDIVRLQYRNISPAQLAQLQVYFNSGYFGWLSGVLSGNNQGTPLLGRAFDGLGWTGATLELVLPAWALGAWLGLPFGVLSVRKSLYLLRLVGIWLIAVPAFWVGGLLLYEFAFVFPLFPSFGSGSPFPPYFGGSQFVDQAAHFVLPFSSLAIASFAMFSVLGGYHAREFKGSGFLASLKGTAKGSMAGAGLVFALLLTATIGVEVVFAWPGLGYATIFSLFVFDIPNFSGAWLILGTMGLVAIVGMGLVHAIVGPSEMQPGLQRGLAEVWHSGIGKLAAALVGATLVLAAWGALFAPYPERSFACLYQGCSGLPPFVNAAHPFGTEVSGIDVFSETLHGLANDLAASVVVALIGFALGSLLILLSRVRAFSYAVVGALYFVASAQVIFVIGALERVVALSGAASFEVGTNVLFLGGILASFPISAVASRRLKASADLGLVRAAVPGAIFVTGVAMLLLQYMGFFGLLSPNYSSIGLLLQEGFIYLRTSWWVWVMPEVLGGFAVFSLFFLSDLLLRPSSVQPAGTLGQQSTTTP